MEHLPRSMKRAAAASGGSYRQPTDCSNCRGALVACDMNRPCARCVRTGCAHLCSSEQHVEFSRGHHLQPPPQQLHSSSLLFSSSSSSSSSTSSTSSAPSPQSLDSESPPPSYYHHHYGHGHTPPARAAADGPGSCACDAGPQLQPLLALVERLGLKLDRLERDNAQLRADLQALTARQLDTDATVGRLRAQLAAATAQSTTNSATTAAAAATTTTGEPAAKRSRRPRQAEVTLGWNGGDGASLAFQHHQAGEAGVWRSRSSLLNLRRLMPFLDPYVLPDTFVPPDQRGPVLCTQVTAGGAAPPVFVFANSALCELFGCTPAEVIGQPLTSFAALDREKAARFAKTRSKTPLYVGPALPIRSLFRARSGQLWRAYCSLHIFFDQHGDPKHVLNSLVRWEPGQLEGSEAFDQWTPVSELCQQLLVSSQSTTNSHTPHTPHATPARGPDLFPPWLSAPGDLKLEDQSPSDYWTLL